MIYFTSNVTPSEYFKLKELFGKAPSWFPSVTVHKLNQVSLRSLLCLSNPSEVGILNIRK